MNTYNGENKFPHPHNFAQARALVVAGLLLGGGNVFAQNQSDQATGTAQPAQPDSLVQITADAMNLQPATSIPRVGGTFWVVVPGGRNGVMALPYPSLPSGPTMPIYSLTPAGNEFLVDGTGGNVFPNTLQSAGTASSAMMSAAVNLEGNYILNLISGIQTAQMGSQLTTGTAMYSPDIPGFGGGDDGTNSYSPDGLTNSIPVQNYGTNLWIAQTTVSSGYLNAIGSNTIADVSYEILTRTNLVQFGWQSYGFFSGSELTNWTPFSVFQGQNQNLFVWLRSWQDTYDIGIPDWWQFEYFGTNGIDPDASPENDGFSNLQKFDLGLNPTNYYNPNGPPGFFGYLDATGTNVFIAWNSAPGPVINYSVQRGVFNSLSGLYSYSQIATVNSNANFIEDVGAVSNNNATNDIYQLEAVYPGGSLSATDVWQVAWFLQYGTSGAPYGPPWPTNFYVCADTNATNVLLSWTTASSVATNYLIERGIFNTASNAWVYHPIASASPAANSFTVSHPFTNAANWSDNYAMVAIYPGAVQAPWAISPVNVGNTNGLAGPGNFFGYADGSGTNLVLTWTPAAGAPTNYVIFAGTTNTSGTCAYVKLTSVNAGATSILVTNGYNNLYDAYAIFATYTNGGMSQAVFWQSANGTPAPGNFVAYLDGTGTNVWLTWTAPAGAVTGYQVTRLDDDNEFFYYNVSSNRTWFEDTNAVHYGQFDSYGTTYTIQAFYAHGGASLAIQTWIGPLPTPTSLSATLDVTGKNITVTWSAVPGATGYVLDRGVLNPATGNYTYAQIATVGSGVTSYVDTGVITGANSYNNHYQVGAIFPGGVDSVFADSSVSESSDVPLSNVYLTANSVRNGSGRWQIMFSGVPTNSPQTIQLTWTDDFSDIVQTNLSTTNLIAGVFQLPDAFALNLQTMGYYFTVTAQLFGPNGEPGQIANAGFFANDAPYFVDGRRHMKQNLDFLLRAAPVNQLFFSVSNAGSDANGGQFNVTSTSFEEFSFLHHFGWGGYGPTYGIDYEDLNYFQIDDLWPFAANYDLANYVADPARTNSVRGDTNFVYQPNFAATVPAPAILTLSDPCRILQPGVGLYVQGLGGTPSSEWGLNINSQGTGASLSAGNNLFGLQYNSGYLISNTNAIYSYQILSPGGNVTVSAGYQIDDYASWSATPSLSLINYYFAPMLPAEVGFTEVIGLALPGEIDPYGGSNIQPYPVPIEDDFNVTNQTPPIIASVGQPMIIAGWAKYSVGTSGKFAYLGQYFQTNVLLLNSNGVATTNTAGVMSPYGEFFPLQTGTAQFVTMPDIDNPSQQGTGVVQIISMNVDANHDGTLDLSYGGPDFVSASKPFRFWINDDQDSGDFGGDGVPGKGVWGDANMYTSHYDYDGRVLYYVHGTRDLVDFFPVYLNIGALTKVLPSSGSIKYILKQEDAALRFLYTELTPINYMNFLRDTNEASRLATNYTMAIPPEGYILDSTFVNSLATNNQGILLMEGSQNTTNPLVLEVWQGSSLNNGDNPYLFTPQKMLGQTILPLSLSGVEQMFRHKNLMLDPNAVAPPDRISDTSVPNEPDTVEKNFLFLHGYNVNTNEARGVASDIYKRMYWSGSHAKFWAVTWEGADTKELAYGLFTPDYHTNVYNAFLTAQNLASFITGLSSSGPVSVAAHSLGNMVTLSAISDLNAPVSQYFMMDAAAAMEAVQGWQGQTISTTLPMVYSSWVPYTNRLYANQWCGLFSDSRYLLTWSNRLANLHNVDVYNFYSSGEEVLRTYTNDPPSSVLSGVETEVQQYILGHLPLGVYAWAWQEKGKGRSSSDLFIGSRHGGWSFSTNYADSSGVMMSPAIAANLLSSQLQTNSFFSFGNNDSTFHPDLALLGPSGASYAMANHNRILSDAIPASTLPVGANTLATFSPPSSPDERNFDMQTQLENSWPAGRGKPQWPTGTTASGEWHHSDFHEVAYTFTHNLFDTIVSLGNLK